MIDLQAGFAEILGKEPEDTQVLELLDLTGETFRAPEVYGTIQNICYKHGLDPQDFMGALEELMIKMGLNTSL